MLWEQGGLLASGDKQIGNGYVGSVETVPIATLREICGIPTV